MIYENFLSKLSQNLLEILNDEEYYDVTIEVGNDPDVKIFCAHIAILNHRSPYLRKILSTCKKNNDEILTNIKLPNISPEIFEIVLRYIYGGMVSLEKYDTSDIIKILVAANELSLQELFLYFESFLIENETNWMEQNFDLIYQTSFRIDSLELKKYCNDLIFKEPNKIFNFPCFSSIPEKLLVTVIQNDNLQMGDIEIWERVIKWGLAQNPELPSDLANFSKDDFSTLKNTLRRCIPFIKFYDLTSKEFLRKVLPYKKILPKELYKSLLSYFLDNNDDDETTNNSAVEKVGSNNIDSKIITLQHAELISKWIDKLEITDELTNSYEFKLLYRDSRDGCGGMYNKFNKFYEVCKDQFRTVTIYKVKDSDEILGGYNPIDWKSNGKYGITNDSFIFSFSDGGIGNYALSRVKNESKAIFNCSHSIPSFGHGDIEIFNGTIICCNKRSYENPIRTNNEYCILEDFEVFQIV
ncbi:carbohydrate-binding module family 13 protein [Rhizophagus clarus]|uniref:Carbohydrate-binding module family 13 protein n=1 Tax=Rhizophagus clarus TaxID=94130 RepID=A0A8H3QEQ3_9GLOM|nr:carbohydrate-binding module family 13 protein [Rhizophagus clarus]